MASKSRSSAAEAATVADTDAAEGDDSPFFRSSSSHAAQERSIPYLYDFYYEFGMDWPMYTSAWGCILPDSQSALTLNHQDHRLFCLQRLFYAQATSSHLNPSTHRYDGPPNLLVRAEMPIPRQPRTVEMRKLVDANQSLKEDMYCSYCTDSKVMIHPGEVNRIVVMPSRPEIVVTHSDSALVFVWNTDRQVNRNSKPNAKPSIPDCTLIGHLEQMDNNMYYALDCSSIESSVVSGGPDKQVCLWSLNDYITSLSQTNSNSGSGRTTPTGTTSRASISSSGSGGAGGGGGGAGSSGSSSSNNRRRSSETNTPNLTTSSSFSSSNLSSTGGVGFPSRTITARMIFIGHSATVEDVSFRPQSVDELCSVGDDRLCLVWDTRVGNRSVIKIETGHEGDVNCVSWNPVYPHFIVTGSSDTTLQLIDLRQVSSSSAGSDSETNGRTSPNKKDQASRKDGVIHTFRGHKRDVKNVSWSPDGLHFVSGGNDAVVNIWSIRGLLERQQQQQQQQQPSSSSSSVSPSASTTDSPLFESRVNSYLSSVDDLPPELLFRHLGHRTAIESICWNRVHSGGWTLSSINHHNGGVMQIWRPNDMLWKPKEEASRVVKEWKKRKYGAEKAEMDLIEIGEWKEEKKRNQNDKVNPEILVFVPA